MSRSGRSAGSRSSDPAIDVMGDEWSYLYPEQEISGADTIPGKNGAMSCRRLMVGAEIGLKTY